MMSLCPPSVPQNLITEPVLLEQQYTVCTVCISMHADLCRSTFINTFMWLLYNVYVLCVSARSLSDEGELADAH